MRAIAIVLAALVAALLAGCDVGSDDGDGGDRRTSRVELPEPKQPAASAPTARMEGTCDRVSAPWGSDAGPGSPRRPFRSAGRLAVALGAGQTGCLRGGTYTQEIVFVRAPRATIRSAPGERAVWRGRIVLDGEGDRLVGLTLDGTGGPLCDEGRCGVLPSPTITAPDVVVADNDITNREGICVHPSDSTGRSPDRFVIARNRVHDCGRRPATENDHGIYVAAGRDGVIRDNVVFGNADRGIQLYPDAHETTIVNNTVDGNGTGIIFSERSSGNVARDNVVSNSVRRFNAETFDLTGGGNRFVENCVKPGNPDSDYNANGGVQLDGPVTALDNVGTTDDPYRDRANGDFRLVPGSRCAGKGAPASVAAP